MRRTRTTGVALSVTVLTAASACVTHYHRGPLPVPAAAAAATTTTTIPSTSSAPSSSTSTTLAPPPTTTPTGPWRPVPRAPTLYQLTTPAGTVFRIDPGRFEVAVVPGTTEPGGTFPEGGQVPAGRRGALVLATNAGFKRRDARGGELVDGRTVGTLAAGSASLVIHSDGTVDVGAWGTTVGPRPDNVAVLQNLTLLVDGGKPVANLGANIIQQWGATFRPALPTYVWRSGVGVDSAGQMLWAAGPSLVPAELAQLLVSAGAVRAMQLDINHLWVFASLFVHPDPQHPDQVQASPLLANMTPAPTHVLVPGPRDFLAFYQRPAPG